MLTRMRLVATEELPQRILTQVTLLKATPEITQHQPTQNLLHKTLHLQLVQPIATSQFVLCGKN
jgi:hypothetical protein